MIALLSLVFALLVGWVVSGSLGYLLVVGAGVLIYSLFKLARIPIHPFILLSILLLLAVIESLLYRNEFFTITFETLPEAYHVAIACLSWGWMFRGRSESIDNFGFLASLLGSILLFYSLANVEIFRWPPLLVRCLGVIPLVLTLIVEFQGKRNSIGQSLAIFTVGVLLLGGLCDFSRTGSKQLSQWLSEDIIYEDDLDDADDVLPGSESTRLSATGGVVHLARKADIVVDHEVRFYLKARNMEDYLALIRDSLYLRTSTVSIFEGNEKLMPINIGEWLLDSDDGLIDEVTTLPEKMRGQDLEYSIVMPETESSMLPLVPGSNRIRANEVYHFAEARYQISSLPNQKWLQFYAIGPRELPDNNIAPIKSIENPVYLSLPSTALANRIQQLTEKVIAGNVSEEAISNYISKQCSYSLKYKNPDNLTPIENLLFGEKKGHCELFAGATVLMLRSAGIPSRIAYGYTGGASNRNELAVAFRGSDLHAWAEILDQSGEWRIFDTTPGERGASRIAQPGKQNSIDWRPASFRSDMGMDLSQPSLFVGNSVVTFLTTNRWVSGGIVIVLLGSLLFLIRRWLAKAKARQTDRYASFAESPEQIASSRPGFISELLSLGESNGIPRLPGVTLREYVDLLQRQGIGYQGIKEAVEYFYQVRYAAAPVDPGYEKQIIQSLRECQKSVAGH